MNPVKRAIRDDKDEKARRRNIPCHIDALAEDFARNRFTNEAMLPTLNPTEVVATIMAHNNYQDLFVKAVSVDLGSYCSSQIDIWSLDKAWLNDDHDVEDKFPEVCKYF